MSDVLPNDPQEASGEGLQPLYKSYARQKCFIGYSERAPWAADLLEACATVLQEPAFNLEADYARKHLSSDTPLREKALELIANARCGIYDISHWRVDARSAWLPPRNVFIELGIAVALNRPALLLRHAENAQAGLALPKCLESLPIVEWTGDVTLKQTLRAVLPQWIRQDPERAWWHRHCTIGGSDCKHRESHPRARSWTAGVLRCHIADGHDVDQADFRAGVERELGRFDVVEFEHLDALPPVEGYRFLLCSHCQAVRSNRFAIYRITPQTAAETYLAIGMSIGLEKQFGYRIPKITFAESAEAVPSLLAGYDVVTGQSNRERTTQLAQFMPEVIIQIRQMPWRPSPLPFISTTEVGDEDLEPAGEAAEEVLAEAAVESAHEVPTGELVAGSATDQDQSPSQDAAVRTCPSCRTANRAEAKFCANCGVDLSAIPIQSGPLTPGTILRDYYQVVRFIGGGALSTVYEVKDLRDSPPSAWALREIRTEEGGKIDRLGRYLFDQSAAILESLSHKGVPSFRDRFDYGGRAYIVEEYVAGRTLDSILESRGVPLGEEETLSWAIQICDILEYLHTRLPPIINRNLKPGTIMITLDGSVKIINFGAARTYKAGKSKDTVQMGTAGYASPEQHGTGQTDARSDIYALGATMYRLLTNQDPPVFTAADEQGAVSVLNPNVSLQTSAIVAKAMHRDRNQRYQSAAEMRQAIAAVGQSATKPGQPSVGADASLVTCGACGTVNRPNSRFCGNCGTVLPPGAAISMPTDPSVEIALPETLPSMSVLVGRYRIGKLIEARGIGTVYEATDIKTGRPCEIERILLADLGDDREVRLAKTALELEARILLSLSHAGLARGIDYFSASGSLFLALEGVPGQSLDDLMAQSHQPFPEGQVIDWAIQLCDAVNYLHGQTPPIMHRDIKPANIFVDQSGRVKLTGFGIARFHRLGMNKDTQPMSLAGTPGYGAPEQYGRVTTDARSDIYSLGATMHFLLTCRDPDPISALFQFPEVRTLNPQISPQLSAIVARAVEVQRERRFQNGAEMLAALLAISGMQAANSKRQPSGLQLSEPQPATSVSKTKQEKDHIPDVDIRHQVHNEKLLREYFRSQTRPWILDRIRSRLSDAAVDTLLSQGLEKIKAQSMAKLSIVTQDLVGAETLVICAPVLWTTFGIDDDDLVFKVGDDSIIRFGVYRVTVIHLTRYHLDTFGCDYNFLKDAILNEETGEYPYRHVVSVATRDFQSNYTLQSGETLTHVQEFGLHFSSGEKIEVVIEADKLTKIKGRNTLPETGADKAVTVIRKMMREISATENRSQRTTFDRDTTPGAPRLPNGD